MFNYFREIKDEKFGKFYKEAYEKKCVVKQKKSHSQIQLFCTNNCILLFGTNVFCSTDSRRKYMAIFT